MGLWPHTALHTRYTDLHLKWGSGNIGSTMAYVSCFPLPPEGLYAASDTRRVSNSRLTLGEGALCTLGALFAVPVCRVHKGLSKAPVGILV